MSINRPGVKSYLFVMLVGISTILLVICRDVFWKDVDAGIVTAWQTKGDHGGTNFLHHVFLTLAVVILIGATTSRLCAWLGQPPVIGQMIAGLLLGPSFLGIISPELMRVLIPDKASDPTSQVANALMVLSQFGIVLYMFLVGIQLNTSKLTKHAATAIMISHASIVAPFATGCILSLWLYPEYSPSGQSFVPFSLFLGVAMSITAFPVLARILSEKNLQQTSIGNLAMGCAAVDDITAWCLLALVVGIAKSDLAEFAFVLCGAAIFVGVMLFVVKPFLQVLVQRFDKSQGQNSAALITIIYFLILASAAATQSLGLHAIFGAFLLGVLVPSNSLLASHFKEKLTDPVTILLLPAFFAYTGMRTEIGTLNSANDWLVCIGVIFTATAGKFGGTYLAAWTNGLTPRESSILGVLMNTRGLMELIVLNIGLDMGVINSDLFTIMVIMALVTTFMTSPIISVLIRDRFGDNLE